MQDFLHSIESFLGPIGQVFHFLFYLPVYNVLMVIYEGLAKVVPGAAFALAIIILTLIIRAALIPLTRKQLSSTRKMQLIQPQLKALQQQYRGDPQTLMAEQRKLYKDNGVSMYGGCLPLVVQMPFLYALYYSLFTLISNDLHKINGDLYPFIPHLQHLPQTWFIWTSLAVPDTLHILPIIAALLTFAQMRMALPVRKKPQPGENPDPTSQAMGTTQYIMPLITLFFGWTFPAGLALYWCISTGFSAVQQYFINGNFGSLFLGVPGMEHLVPEPKDLTPTTTRAPVAASGGAARAIVAESPPAEGGIRGWWNRMRESATAAQTQAMERAEQARQAREEEAQARQQAADGTTGKNAPARRQRPARQGPVLLQPPQPSGAESGAADESTEDATDDAIQRTVDTSAPAEKPVANGTNGGSSSKTAKPSSNGANGANGANKAGGASGARNNANNANNASNGTRSATTGGSNAARKNSSKGGSGGRSGSGRPKRR